MDKKINLADLERENEQLRRQLAELDEPPNKNRGDLKGVQNIATSVSKGIRSMPGQKDSYYIDLYFLQKERERLVKEIASLKRRRLQLGVKISNIDKKMAEKGEKALQDMAIMSVEPPEKPDTEKRPHKKQETPKSYEYKEEEWNRLTLEY